MKYEYNKEETHNRLLKEITIRINRLNLLVEHSLDMDELKRATYKMERLLKVKKLLESKALEDELSKARDDIKYVKYDEEAGCLCEPIDEDWMKTEICKGKMDWYEIYKKKDGSLIKI